MPILKKLKYLFKKNSIKTCKIPLKQGGLIPFNSYLDSLSIAVDKYGNIRANLQLKRKDKTMNDIYQIEGWLQ